ncbi:DEAD-box ATP-dependent RNA helicase 21 [Phytophthora fragariae]|uniref:RNA helicase n=1 Tax=Phytophthora fragariae TaxID=53985 RepID=A0A6A3FAH8_9STRA|nr:DEAD-box ATP-dependent RNA helicase 21 [Phytophthora fragariae]KAE8939128.1 DEAD-box ATP-dependent RNA helicase 21 [Phytophthora fragariae]KAE9115194.1 DEAD-box ATP-dependent RNA helicase 21 [Phytophthora fragariae]KAE9115272.1 DEAD-box ATP-dependent RNA helicase 21 [Phytophthora fragariae]KAE9152952.1 DEAD-box ATP-dependent RNA helicase 21 [Phytophthora fragariae]
MADQRKRRRSRSRSRSASKRPSVHLDEEQRKEAERVAAIARRAEERAAERKAKEQPADANAAATGDRKLPLKIAEAPAAAEEAPVKPKFRSKAQRQKDALERLEMKRQEMDKQRKDAGDARRQFLQRQRSDRERDRGSRSNGDRRRDDRAAPGSRDRGDSRRGVADPSSTKKEEGKPALLDPSEAKALQALKDQYLGKTVKKKKVVKASEKFSKIFQFDWEASEDTSTDLNPLYAHRMDVNLLYGRGYRAGVDMREQRKKNSFLEELSHKRQKEQQLADETDGSLTSEQIAARKQERDRALRSMQARERDRMQEMASREAKTMGTHWSEKSLDEMKERDWRIFREDFDITLKGGRAPNPLRKWDEAGNLLPDAVFKAIKDLGFERPSPIQMQAIPIGLQKRDIIGIAETGSGKTAAFVIPIIAYIYSLPPAMVARTGEQGPLALVMAPTRELALQIEQEAIKLCKYTSVGLPEKLGPIKTLSVVGGQSIEDQGFRLREGVEIIIGTPGRLMDCLESHYLVLNQCNYVVLDEADRMIDMGFEPQVVAVLENMGSLLKSENEEEMEQQLMLANGDQPGEELQHQFRVTTMFSATMPVEVERLAKTFLRHPSIVKIGDEDSGKNKRIDQRVLFMKSGKKRAKLVEVLRDILSAQSVPIPRSRKEKVVDGAKIIVFVNIKKECDSVAKFISNEGFRCTILHGGKTQDQREESLKMFREGYCDMLVATDVAGRGLDIPDVTHVVNFDLPSKIQNYTHRIGRTGRAGKDGVAISLLTDDDEEIMYDLKQYLVSTEMPVPSELANHPSAKAAPGARDEKGNIIARSKRDTVIYAK